MNFDLGPDERALQAAVRDVCRARFPMERVRAGFDREGWRALAEAGVFSLRLPGARGGAGLGVTEAVIVFEELGRALVPGPLVATHLAATLVEGGVDGSPVVGTLESEVPSLLVEHHDDLDTLVVVGNAGLWRLDARGMEVVRVADPLDPLTPLHRVVRLPEGEIVGGPEDSVLWRIEGAALTAALLTGNAARTTELAVAYAKERRQFGRSIGSFQAIKHICADMVVRAEVARAAVHAAGCMLDDPQAGEAVRAVSAAKLLAGEAALANAKACIQVHGGMGFTWEVDAHLYLKRAAVFAASFGGSDVHAASVAEGL